MKLHAFHGEKIWMMKRLILISLLSILSSNIYTQEEPSKWEINGYLKQMQTFLFFNESFADPAQSKLVDTFLLDNLIHNRVNIRYYANEKLTLRADIRSRIFYGDLVQTTPNFGQQIDNANNDYLDLSLILLNDNSWVIHSMLDRLYLEYMAGDWEIRLGRQRINWGINTIWNPNDIFNAFAFTDFDYEERPGSDALLVRKYFGFVSSLEIAVRAFDHWDEAVIAGLWKFNTGQYDYQLLIGYVRSDIALGAGWAGNIGNAGFKGEMTYFHPTKNERTEAFALTFAADYQFANALYLNLGYLYNSEGRPDANIVELFNFDLSARNLYPYRHSIVLTAQVPLSPLWNASLSTIYSPGATNASFFTPRIAYSLKDNWDIDLTGQVSFFNNDGYTSPLQAFFLRTKWSF
ncbi:MAG: hypothetical protein AAFO07_03965 [Bacteroidota bacterium]